MAAAPLVSTRRTGQRLVGSAVTRLRRPPTPAGLARRRFMIMLAKLSLPTAALTLLTTMALWPELRRTAADARLNLGRAANDIAGDTVFDARYHGVDEHGRPYTVTAETAVRVDPNRIDLTNPKGDTTLENGTWLMLQAEAGVYRQRDNALDLSRKVTLYRDDGTTLITASAAVDIKQGAAAGSEPVHAEGPFGVLDADGGFTLTDKGEQIQFAGPAHLVLNGANPQ
jgi:lipopolysaccharide export system protein LptC